MTYCSVDSCNIKIHARQLCNSHYRRLMRHGHTEYERQETGLSNTVEYKIWEGAKKRCFNKTAAEYKNYGGRGITMSTEWRYNFLAFLEDVGHRPSSEYSLDRIDNDGNYEPGNVAWSTRHQQAANTTRNTSAVVGVTWNKRHKSWFVRLNVQGKSVLHTQTQDYDTAVTMRKAAEAKFFARPNPTPPSL